MSPTYSPLFTSDLWMHPLESYASAAGLTVKLFDTDARVVFGPIHTTLLFQFLQETAGYDPGIYTECARQCLAQTSDRSAILVSRYCGLAVVGTSLALEGEIMGAAVGGYALVDFIQPLEIQRLALDSGIPFERLWRVAHEQKPVPRRRLILNGELLQVLADALLKENHRTHQYEQTVLKLEESARANAEAHRELEQAAAGLHRVNEDLKQFAFAASHDLQEPLRMVTSYSQLLVQSCGDQLSQEQSLCLSFIEEGTGRMRKLLADLHSYLQIDLREEELDQQVDLNVALENALENLKLSIEESQAAVTHGPLPLVTGQQVHFVQLFQNLISNAIKYRRTSAPDIRIWAEKCEKEWRLAVADNGIGIDPEYHRTVFGVFKRLHGGMISGSGIGLAICQRVVERYGGRICVESQPGVGATFYFTLPIAGEG